MSQEARTDWVPQLKDGLVVTELPISDPFEGFILSRIDGGTSVKDIAHSTGASLEQVQALLRRLQGMGALNGPGAGAEPAASAPSAEAPKRRRIAPPVPPAPPAPEPGPAAPEPEPVAAADATPEPLVYDPAELDEEADLDRDRKHEILDAYYRLGSRNYYELLGISRDADKGAIRAAYFALSKRFHPDTLFGKQLGSFKSKMEKVFERLTAAYETLGKKKRRREYDEYLEVQDSTRALETSLEDAETAAADVAESVLPPPGDRAALENAATDRPPAPDQADPTAPPAVSAPEIPKAPKPPRLTSEERRAMAKKLMERRLRGAPVAPPPPSPKPVAAEDRLAAAAALEQSLQAASGIIGGGDQARQFIETADTKEAEGDTLAAVNALKMALAIDPDHEELQERHDRLRAELAAQMSDTYLKQARYEEQHENWEAAARSWQKVAEGRPTEARARRQAALALLQAEGDLRLARDLAQEAVKLQPTQLSNRVALARVFIAAKMKASARKELEHAAKLDPNAEIVKTLQRELK